MPSICLSTSLKTNHALIKKLLLFLERFPGALAAYSLRQLHPDALFAIRVRRSSDDQEMDIGFTPTGKLNESGLLTFVGNGDGFVVIWYDQSGNNNHASQSAESEQPKIMNAGAVIKENRKPALRFTGTEGLVFNMGSSYSQYAIFSVLTFSRTDVLQVPFRDFTGGSSTAVHAYANPNGGFYRLSDNRSGFSTDIATEFGTSQSLLYMGDLGSTGEVYVNGILRIDGFGTVGAIYSKIALGRNGIYKNAGLQGTMQEFILYSSNQSANRPNIEANINNYYSVY